MHVHQMCAARGIETEAGRVSAVVTERRRRKEMQARSPDLLRNRHEHAELDVP
jgi:hypothetical protein